MKEGIGIFILILGIITLVWFASAWKHNQLLEEREKYSKCEIIGDFEYTPKNIKLNIYKCPDEKLHIR